MINRRTVMIALSRCCETLSLEKVTKTTELLRSRTTSIHSPGYLSVYSTFDLSGSGVNEVRNKFQVAIIEQVLAADRQLDARSRFPAHMHVKRVIAGNVQSRQATYVPHDEVVQKRRPRSKEDLKYTWLWGLDPAGLSGKGSRLFES